MTKPFRFGVVASRFNEDVTDALLASCVRTLAKNGVARSRLAVARVPGSWEIPWAAQEMALSGRFDAVICIGAILKGETPQNHHLARSVIEQIQAVSLKTRVPLILGVITPDTRAQAMARTRGSLDRGREAALAALEMAEIRRRKPWE